MAEPSPKLCAVLLAEGDGLLRLGIRQLFNEVGYPVEDHGSGDSALTGALARAAPPALLIAAVRLPGVDGASLARALRARWPGLPLILLAEGGLDREGCWRGLPLRCAVLEKPVTEEVLLAVARRLMRRRAGLGSRAA